MNMDINLDLYKVFCIVARNGSLSKAAGELFVSQSAVSQSIKQLEEQIGGKLFNRTARGVMLTTEGKMLFDYADGAYTLLKNAEKKFSEMKNLKTGILKIGASDTVCRLFLRDALNRYCTEYPDIRLSVINRTSDELLKALRLGEVDMTFINLPINNSDGFTVKQIMQTNDCFVVSGRYSHLAHRDFSLKELEKYPVLMLDKTSSSRRIMDKFLSSNDVNIKPSVELTSIDLLMDFAKIGLGIAVVVEQAAQDKFESGELFKLQIDEPIPKRAIGLVTLSGVSLSFAAQEFIRQI